MPPTKRHAACRRGPHRGPKFTPPINTLETSLRSSGRGQRKRGLGSLDDPCGRERSYIRGDCLHTCSANQKEDSSIPLAKLIKEKSSIDMSTGFLRAKVENLSSLKHTEAIEQLLALQETLQSDVMALRHELEGCRDSDPHWAEELTGEAMRQRATAETWTNNIEILASWLCRMFGQDQQRMELLQRECYGPEYEEGNGLREL